MTPVHYSRSAAVGHSFMEQTYLKCTPTVEQFVIIHLHRGESKDPSCDPAPFASPIKDPAEAQKVNMGTIKSTWALDVLGVGLKMQRAVRSALTMFGCRSGEKLLKCGLCIAITVVTITRQCHEAAAGKRASRSAQFKLKMRSCEEVRRRQSVPRCAQSPLSNVQTVQSFFAAFAFSRAAVPPESSSASRLQRYRSRLLGATGVWIESGGKTKPRNYPVMVESISDWHHISIPQSITDYGSRVLKRCQIT